MDAIQLLVGAFEDLHEAVREDMAGVEPELLWWQPQPGLNHVGFLFWHVVRDEDNVVPYVRGLPELWASERWNERFGMGAREQGTGFPPERLAAFRYDVGAFMEHAERVWARTGEQLRAMSPEDLQKPAWEWTAAKLLTEGCLGHGWVHLGEIRAIKGLRGWRFRE